MKLMADSNVTDDQRKIAYLQLIQEPISRMSTTSAIFKGFAATIVVGISSLQYSQINNMVLILSFMPEILFATIDIYYLQLERRYRYLYNQVKDGKHKIDYSLELPKDLKNANARFIDCIKSPSIWLFYLPLIAILLAVYIMKVKVII